MNFEIADPKPINKGTLKGTFALMAGPLKIEGWTYHVKGGSSWVNPPSKEYIDDETGNKKYRPIIWIEGQEKYRDFQKWAVKQVEDIFEQPEPAQKGYQEDGDDIPF